MSSTFFRFLLASFSTISVPCTFVSMVLTGLSTMRRTPTAAARWKTTSARSTSSARTGSLSTLSIV